MHNFQVTVFDPEGEELPALRMMSHETDLVEGLRHLIVHLIRTRGEHSAGRLIVDFGDLGEENSGNSAKVVPGARAK